MKKDDRKYNTILGEIRKLGLDKKEAETYLLLLEKGPQTVLEVSKQMGISRPTVYRVLERLSEMELVFLEKQEKKNRFAASSPDGFLRILRIRRRRAEEQEREFLRIVSLLQSRYHLLSNKNEVKFFDKKILLEDFSSTLGKNTLVLYSKGNLSDARKMAKIYPGIRKRMGQIKIKEIFPVNFEESELEYVQRKKVVLPKAFRGTIIVSNKVFILRKTKGLVLEEAVVVGSMKMMLKTIWKQGLKK